MPHFDVFLFIGLYKVEHLQFVDKRKRKGRDKQSASATFFFILLLILKQWRHFFYLLALFQR